MSELTNESARALTEAIEKLTKKMSGAVGGMASAASGRSKASAYDEAEMEEYNRSVRLAAKSLSGQTVLQKKLSAEYPNMMQALSDQADALASGTLSEEKKAEAAEKTKNILDDYNKTLSKSSNYIQAQTIEMQKLSDKSLPEQQVALALMVKGTESLTTTLAKNQRNASLLSASMIESSREIDKNSIEYSTYINNLGKAAGGLDESFLKNAGFFDEFTGKISENLQASDFAQLRLKLGEAQTNISEAFGNLQGFGITDVKSLLAEAIDSAGNKTSKIESMRTGPDADHGTADKVDEAIKTLAIQLEKAGHDLGLGFKLLNKEGQLTAEGLERLATVSTVQLAKGIEKVETQIEGVVENLKIEAAAANTALGKWTRTLGTAEGRAAFFADKMKKLGETATITAGLAKLGSAAKAVGSQIANFNIAQVPASFGSVQKASIRMGMSFDDTVKFMQENKRLLATYGGDMNDTMEQTKIGFAKFGYTMAQAADMMPDVTNAAISGGVDISKGENLNKFIDQSMESFKRVSGIVNMTAKEYFALNADLLNSQDITDQLIGMDQERAQAEKEDILKTRDHYVAMGLSAQAANDLLKAQKAQQNAPVREKALGAAKAQTLAMQLGIDPKEAARLGELMKKNRSNDETAEMTAIQQKMGVAEKQQLQDAQDTGGTAAYQAKQAMFQQLSTPETAAGMASGVEALKQKRAGMSKTDEQALAAGQAATGSKTVADAGNIINSASSLIGNEFTKAIWGATTALAGLAIQALGAGGGKGLIQGAKGAWDIGKKLMTGAGAAGGEAAGMGMGAKYLAGVGGGAKLAAGLAKGGVMGLGGMALDYGGDKLKESGHEKLGAAASIGGDALSYAGTGALIGSVIPGLGTAIGGAIGGVIGTGVGLYRNGGELFASSPDAPKSDAKSAVAEPVTAKSNIVAEPAPTKANALSTTPGAADVNNTSTDSTKSASGIINVADSATQQQLELIAGSMIEAVTYLKKIAEAESDDKGIFSSAFRGNDKQVPTAYQYKTGRA